MENVISYNMQDSSVEMNIQWQPSLGLSRLDNDAILMHEIINILLQTLTGHLNEVKKNSYTKEFKKLRKITHSQLPSLKILGFDKEASVFEAFESAVVIGDDITCERLTPAIQKIWIKIIEALTVHKLN
jgi:hypothetical protein